jgi:phage replication O-like protein O
MSEKLKPNFTAVPNVIFDRVLCTLAPGATKVLFAICRFTYGYGKTSDRISLKQLQDMTGMARGSVARSVKELGPLVTVTAGDPSRQMASEYRLNIGISDAELVSLYDQQLVSKRDQASLPASLIKRPSKESPKKEDMAASKKRSQHSSKDKNPSVKEFLNWFAAGYFTRFKQRYHVRHGKDGDLVKNLLTTFDLPELQRRAVRLWESEDKFISATDRGIGILSSQINKLGGAPLRAVSPRGTQEITAP